MLNPKKDMKIVMDEKIPYLCDALQQMGCEVVALPGMTIGRDDVADADALFVRTRTLCDKNLLAGSAVRFIGTATIGHDHINAEYCSSAGIKWCNAAGCNAYAVLQYVQAVVYAWAKDNGRSLAGLSLGVVGVGEIGSKVANWAQTEGMAVYRNDPPKAAAGENALVPLSELAAQCDIITFHPTLNVGGAFPSYHLADEGFFGALERCSLLINASRGPVVDNAALLRYLEQHEGMSVVLDVWEGEPAISLPLLNKVYIATPHIAGYSAEGKMNATRMVLERFSAFAGYTGAVPELQLPPPVNRVVQASSFSEATLGIYSPFADSDRLKANPEKFEDFRNNYTLRRETSAYDIRLG